MRHEQVVVTRLGKNMPGLTLDEIAEHIVGHATAEAAQDFPIDPQGLIEHQRDFIVKTRRRWTDLQGQRIAVRAMEKRRLQSLCQCPGLFDPGLGASTPGRNDDTAAGVNDKQLRKVFCLAELVQQRGAVQVGEITPKVVRQFSQMFPLLARPAQQQLHPGFSDGFEGLFDDRVSRPIEPT